MPGSLVRSLEPSSRWMPVAVHVDVVVEDAVVGAVDPHPLGTGAGVGPADPEDVVAVHLVAVAVAQGELTVGGAHGVVPDDVLRGLQGHRLGIVVRLEEQVVLDHVVAGGGPLPAATDPHRLPAVAAGVGDVVEVVVVDLVELGDVPGDGGLFLAGAVDHDHVGLPGLGPEVVVVDPVVMGARVGEDDPVAIGHQGPGGGDGAAGQPAVVRIGEGDDHPAAAGVEEAAGGPRGGDPHALRPPRGRR